MMKNLKYIGFSIILLFCCNSPKDNHPDRKIPEEKVENLRQTVEKFERNLALGAIHDGQKNDLGRVDTVIAKFEMRYSGISNPQEKVHFLTSYLWDTLGIAFDTARNDLDNILPGAVIKNRRGSCLGISLLILLVAEKAGLPLHGVLVPGHFFVRYRDGTTAENIDAMKKGESKPDAWYAERFGVPANATCYLKDLDNNEIVAVLDYNIANIFFAGRNFQEAIRYYSSVLAAMPDFIEAAGNYAIALSETGKTDSALSIIRSLRTKYPEFKNIDATLGKLLLKKGDYNGALDVFKEALEKDPRNPELLYCAGLACYYLKSFSESEKYLKVALNMEPGIIEAQQLLDKVKSDGNRSGRYR